MRAPDKTTYMESSAPPCQVDDLISALRPIKRHPQDYRGIHLRFSLIDREHKQPYHRRAIATAFNKLINSKNGQLFWTQNFDVVFVCKSVSAADIDIAILAARRAVEDSPLVKEYIEAGRDDELCDWYDLSTEMDHFVAMINGLKKAKVPVPQADEISEEKAPITSLKSLVSELGAANDKTPASPAPKPVETITAATTAAYDPREKRNAVMPMGPIQLDQLERNLIHMEIVQMMAHQTAYVIVGNSKPQPILVEHYLSILDIKKKLLPNYDLYADKWLFQRFTRTLDTKLMQALPKRDLVQGQVVSININVETIFTPQFDKFMSDFKKKNNQPLILEMQLFDVISDIQKFYDAREKLTRIGCRISLDAMDVQSLAILDRELLAVDFLKITWKPEYKDIIKGPSANKITSAISALGKMRIILCHCDTEEALSFGKSVGIHMYQGFLIDKKYGA